MTCKIISVDISVEANNGQSGHERHQLILSEDEQFLGIAFMYASEPADEDDVT